MNPTKSERSHRFEAKSFSLVVSDPREVLMKNEDNLGKVGILS